ncbi:hypothetical protein [Granulicella arctica]|uniref:hypothetical protein n=1 Tax=Granulicella arctica TaxID=940613 RepID=UPI0021DFCBA2|nr:hypothetical protein [Granulicella arctica]
MNLEVKVCLLMPFGVLLSPKFQQEWRHGRHNNPGTVDLRMTARAKRDHQIENRSTRNPMVDNDRSFIPTRRVTHPAALPIAFQNSLTQTAKVLLILPLERVAG